VGDQVTGITGTVVTFQPGLIRMDRDLPGQDLRRGDTVFTYAYRGEGFPRFGSRASIIPSSTSRSRSGPDGTGWGGVHCAATYMDLGRKSWWAEVKLTSGRTGWVEADLAQMPISLC
jgi:hypothetical protein